MKLVLLLIALFGAALCDCEGFQNYCDLAGSCPSASSNVLVIDGASYPFSDYDVISFGNLKMRTGDVQGRAAVRGDASAVEDGVSFGDLLTDTEGSANPYTLVIGGSANILNGEIFPSNSGLFVGGAFTGAANLRARILANCSSAGCLNQYFDASKSYYNSLGAYIASHPSNVDYSIAFGTITLNCTSNAQIKYVSIDASNFSKIIAYATNNCASGSLYVFNIAGNSDVVFDGTPFQQGSIYNILGSGNVRAQTFVFGSILAPNAKFNQPAGTVFGAIVAGDLEFLLQANTPDCPPVTTTTSPAATSGSAPVTTGSAPMTSGSAPVTTGSAPATTGSAPATSGSAPVTTGSAPATSGSVPATSAHMTSGAVPATSAHGTTGSVPATSAHGTTGSVPATSAHGTTGVVHATTGAIPATSAAHMTTGEVPSTTGCVCPSTSTGSASSTGAVATSTGSATTGTPVPPPQPGTCPLDSLEDTCADISFDLNGNTVNFKDYDVVVFGDVTAATGDIEGRLAAGGDVTFGNGFAVGTQVGSSSIYSLISDDLTWGSGALDPQGSTFYAAGNVSVPDYIASQRAGGPCNGCLADGFSNVFQCYFDFQDQLQANADNVVYEAKFSTLSITCNSNTASTHYLTVSPSSLAMITYFDLSGCNENATWIITINGTEDVDFHGGSFPAKPENVIYNIIGEGRTINVNTAVLGSILAPGNYLNQTRGVVIGKVIVDRAYILQINVIDCPAENSGEGESSTENLKEVNGASSAVPSAIGAIFLMISAFVM